MTSKIVATSILFDEALLTSVSLSDRISVPTKRTLTDAGQMHVPCKFARTGTQLYTAGQLGLVDESPTKIITVYRDEVDVFDEASMESFRSAPVTIGHPVNDDGSRLALTADNSKELQVGMLEGMPVRDEDTLGGVLILTAKEAIDALEDGTQELSAGYICDIEDVDGKLYQRNIRANHIAIVAKGRAGSSCRISDDAEVHLADAMGLLETELADAKLVAEKSEVKLVATTSLLDEAKASADKVELELTQTKVELADAKVAASEGVVERCAVMESARLVADMRDLGNKSVAEIRRMVVEDQMPDKDFKDKSEAYIEATFEILVDASKGETPMSKLLKKQDTHITVVDKAIDPVAVARKKMIARQSGK